MRTTLGMQTTTNRTWVKNREKKAAELSLVEGKHLAVEKVHAMMVQQHAAEIEKKLRKPFHRPKCVRDGQRGRRDDDLRVLDGVGPSSSKRRCVGTTAYRKRDQGRQDAHDKLDEYLERQKLPTRADDARTLPDAPPMDELYTGCHSTERPAYLPNKHDTLPIYATTLAAHIRLRDSRSLRDAVCQREQERRRVQQHQERRQREADSYGVSVDDLMYVPGSTEYLPPGQRGGVLLDLTAGNEEGQGESETELGQETVDIIGTSRVVPPSPTVTSDSLASPKHATGRYRTDSELSSQSSRWLS